MIPHLCITAILFLSVFIQPSQRISHIDPFFRNVFCNYTTTIGHDCVNGDFFTIAPGVNISGYCKIGNGVYFGTNASVKNGITVCDNVTVGMGAVVTKDILEEGIYVGNPLRKLARK